MSSISRLYVILIHRIGKNY